MQHPNTACHAIFSIFKEKTFIQKKTSDREQRKIKQNDIHLPCFILHNKIKERGLLFKQSINVINTIFLV